jgi:LemA protein
LKINDIFNLLNKISKYKMRNIIIVVVILAALLGFTYNSMVNPKLEVEKAWSDVQNQYQRRTDLIGNLVETVKGAADFEKSTLEAVISARAKATQVTVDPTNVTPEKLAEFQAAQGQLSQAMGRLMVVSEQYPQLRTNQNFLDLQAEIAGTENRVTRSRDVFNEVVLKYNKAISTFPKNLVAKIFNFQNKEGFKADPESQKAPKVDFSKK